METRKCKVVMLATDDDCNLTLGLNNLLVHHNYTRSAIQNGNEDYINQHLYILSDEEIKENSRSRSAKLRVLKRIESKRVKSKNKYAQFSKIGEQEWPQGRELKEIRM